MSTKKSRPEIGAAQAGEPASTVTRGSASVLDVAVPCPSCGATPTRANRRERRAGGGLLSITHRNGCPAYLAGGFRGPGGGQARQGMISDG